MARIRIYTSMDEYNKIHYSRDFTIVDELPQVGDTYEGEPVIEVRAVAKDCEQGSDAAWRYDTYCVVTSLGEDEDEEFRSTNEYYIAISNTNRVKAKRTLMIGSAIWNTDDLDKLIRIAVAKETSHWLNEEMYIDDDDDRNILTTYFGITDLENFTNRVIDGFMGWPVSPLVIHNVGINNEFTDPYTVTVSFDMNFITFIEDVPYWFNEDPIVIDAEDYPDFERTSVTFENLPAKAFSNLWGSATEGEDWLEQEGYPHWFDLFGKDTNEIMRNFRLINEIIYAPFDTFLSRSGLKLQEFADVLCIPYRTVQEWKRGTNRCSPYIRLLIAEKIGIIKRK